MLHWVGTKVIKDQGPNREKFSFEKYGQTDTGQVQVFSCASAAKNM